MCRDYESQGCRYSRPLWPDLEEALCLSEEEETMLSSPEGLVQGSGRLLGVQAGTGLPVHIKRGPFGLYVQLVRQNDSNRLCTCRARDRCVHVMQAPVSLLSLGPCVGSVPVAPGICEQSRTTCLASVSLPLLRERIQLQQGTQVVATKVSGKLHVQQSPGQ